MIRNSAIILSLSASIFLGACSMLPYKDNFSCEKGKDNGMCGSVTEVYDLSSDMDELRKRADREYEKKYLEEEQNQKAAQKAEQEARNSFRTLKLQEMVESVEIRKIQNETPTIFRYYLSEEEAINRADVILISENDKESKAIAKDLKNKATKDSNLQASKNTKNGKNTHLGRSAKSSPKNDSKTKSNAKQEVDINKLYSGIKIYDNNQSGLNLASANMDNNESNKNLEASNNSNNESNKNLEASNNSNNESNKNLEASNQSAIDCSASSDSKITQINDKVKVCVYRANIRQMPSCKALILRVANRGEELDALFEQGGWVKLKDGSYVHKSIVTKD
ncbi:TPA: TraV family lipoprotein [Campylobacter coli]|uniref:TraV family lipoprotein n=1 Tax=Campylobacter coli TaxID=195 RepID=UPI00092FF720|nr:TraV family lipoprotein [Campylobacter coli]HEB7569750.1 TraV family lipoprotein [Campylobacter coli]